MGYWKRDDGRVKEVYPGDVLSQNSLFQICLMDENETQVGLFTEDDGEWHLETTFHVGFLCNLADAAADGALIMDRRNSRKEVI